MTKRLRFLLVLLLGLLAVLAGAEGEATWSAKLDREDVRAGEVARVVLTAKLKEGWHTYSIVPVQDGPFPTKLSQEPKGDGIESAGPLQEAKPHDQFDPNFQKQVGTFEGSATFYAPIRIKAGEPGPRKLTLEINYEVCNAQNCLPPAKQLLIVAFAVLPGEARSQFQSVTSVAPSSLTAPPAGNAQATDEASAQIKKAQDAGMIPFIIFAFGMGLLSLL
ncbi:MAG TPA: protein-disulfide reductase DsbD domain-containing protein, partial [Fimbriimonadaceae bacterium]|nr:protein-disulfide reductase DsbD domain-containing protein [Fimbriimonadaceae bacterium]